MVAAAVARFLNPALSLFFSLLSLSPFQLTIMAFFARVRLATLSTFPTISSLIIIFLASTGFVRLTAFLVIAAFSSSSISILATVAFFRPASCAEGEREGEGERGKEMREWKDGRECP